MDITFDITKKFNTLINYNCFFDGPTMNPILFLNYPKDIRGSYNFELMNFGLNISEEMEQEFIKYPSFFDDIKNCSYNYRSLLIFGKTNFYITNIKGADLQFSNIDKVLDGKMLYHTWPYKIEKGDYNFECGGYSPFSPHFILINLIADNNSKASITFSSDDYMLMDSAEYEFEMLASNMQTSFKCTDSAEGNQFISNCTNVAGKMFDFDFRNKYFKTYFDKDINTAIAVTNEK